RWLLGLPRLIGLAGRTNLRESALLAHSQQLREEPFSCQCPSRSLVESPDELLKASWFKRQLVNRSSFLCVQFGQQGTVFVVQLLTTHLDRLDHVVNPSKRISTYPRKGQGHMGNRGIGQDGKDGFVPSQRGPDLQCYGGREAGGGENSNEGPAVRQSLPQCLLDVPPREQLGVGDRFQSACAASMCSRFRQGGVARRMRDKDVTGLAKARHDTPERGSRLHQDT